METENQIDALVRVLSRSRILSLDASITDACSHDGGSAQMDEEAIVRQMEARTEALKREFEKGKTELAELEARRTYLHEALLRISGAILVLEELLRDRTERSVPGQDSDRPPSSTRAVGADG